MTGEAVACRELATYLTGSEAKELADRIGDGETLSSAISVIGSARRTRVRELLRAAGLGPSSISLSIAVLRSIEGSHDRRTSITPVWTAPNNLAQHGQLTASVHHYVTRARESVVCSTFNFQRSSTLWKALAATARRTEVDVRIYVDTDAADANPAAWKPTTQQVADEMSGAIVLRTKRIDDSLVRNHAKFISVDHQFLVVTSANFSKSAERHNVELGLVIENPILAEMVERQMRTLDSDIFEVVRPQP